MTATDRYVEVERDGTTATIVLNRPEALNAWTPDSARQITEIADGLRFDHQIRAVVVRAEGAAFCAGADLAALESRAVGRSPGERVRDTFEQLRWIHERLQTLAHLPQPVIMAIHGLCLGAGLELAMMGDLRVAASDAWFGLPEPQLGVSVEAGGDLRLAGEVGAGWAKLLALTGRRIDAGTALRIGVVQQVVAPDALVPAARDLAAEIAANAPLAVQGIKRTINFFAERGLAEAMRFEAASAALCFVSDDLQEALEAGSAGQPARFGGK
jgi:enoyl-CoA hydratase/carnithine racemase